MLSDDPGQSNAGPSETKCPSDVRGGTGTAGAESLFILQVLSVDDLSLYDTCAFIYFFNVLQTFLLYLFGCYPFTKHRDQLTTDFSEYKKQGKTKWDFVIGMCFLVLDSDWLVVLFASCGDWPE